MHNITKSEHEIKLIEHLLLEEDRQNKNRIIAPYYTKDIGLRSAVN